MAGIFGFIKKGFAEFQAFAFQGNMIDLAIAFVIGGAFKSVVDHLVSDIVVPGLSYLGGATGKADGLVIGRFKVGEFIGALVNFLIVALAIFIVMVKIVGTIVKKAVAPPAPSEPTNKECPFCLSVIPIKATKCAHCTADLPVAAA